MGRVAPADTYSVDTHPERFAALHTVADALIAHLRNTYDVEVDEGEETAGGVAEVRDAARETSPWSVSAAKPILRNLPEGWAAWPHAASDS